MATQAKNAYIGYKQIALPCSIGYAIAPDDPIFTFEEVFDHIDLYQYFRAEGTGKGRPPYDRAVLTKIVVFAFMQGYTSLRELAGLCKTDIRFIYLLNGMKAPSFTCFEDLINYELGLDGIAEIMEACESYIFKVEHVDLNHTNIDGTKLRANANLYSWVWKKSCLKSRDKVFAKLTEIFTKLNNEYGDRGFKADIREEYAPEYVQVVMDAYLALFQIKPEDFVHGIGKRKTSAQKLYEELDGYATRLNKYRTDLIICGPHRNSYSKTDLDATFMRVKRDHMGNDTLVPAYNVQFITADGYIVHSDVYQFASDMDTFQPMLDGFCKRYGFYPKYCTGDAGYGSFNNYLWEKERGMELFQKFPTYEKESKGKDKDNQFKPSNFPISEEGDMICPNGKHVKFQRNQPVRGNKFGRTEEVWQCEDCTDCPLRSKCFKGKGNRTIILNRELTQLHEEVLQNLNCIHGALLRMNRSIQAEGAFGQIKANKEYVRFRRRGIDPVRLEVTLMRGGFNLHKFHLSRLKQAEEEARKLIWRSAS